jgi:hypothetical protein
MSNETFAAIVGAVIGGLITGGMTAILLRWQFDHVTKERNRGLAYSLLGKLGAIASHLSVLNHHVERALKEDRAKGLKPSAALGPMPAGLQRVTFSAEELGLVISLGDDRVINALMMTDERHNSILDLAAFYTERRIRFTDNAQPAGVSPERGSFALMATDPAMQLRVAELDSLVAELRAYLASDAGKALNVLQEVADLLKARLGVGFTALPTLGAANYPTPPPT